MNKNRPAVSYSYSEYKIYIDTFFAPLESKDGKTKRKKKKKRKH